MHFDECCFKDRFDEGRSESKSFEGESFDVAGVDVAGAEGILSKGQDCACRLRTCLSCVATVPSTVLAWYPSHDDDNNDAHNHSNNTLNGNIYKIVSNSDDMAAPNTPTTPIVSSDVQTCFEVSLVSTFDLTYLQR